MRARLALTLLLLAGGLVFSVSGPAFACTCAGHSPGDAALETDIAEADAVFVGTVTAIDRRDAPKEGLAAPAFGPVTYTFDVEDNIAGDLGTSAKVVSDASGASCGFRFRPQTRYIVFAYQEGEWLETNICSRTELLTKSTELPVVSPTKKLPAPTTAPAEIASGRVERGDDGGIPPAAVVVGTVLLAGGAVALFARRRVSS